MSAAGAQGLLAEIRAAHGGAERLGRLRGLTAFVRSGGLALTQKWQRRAFREYTIRIDTMSPEAWIRPFKGGIGHFTAERVAIESPDGDVRRERTRPRDRMPSPRRHLWWDDLDVLYFGGYAMWNYLAQPLLLGRADVTLWAGASWTENGETWRRLHARFPDGLPTHSREQVFHVDAHGRIRRHDYTAEPIGGFAKACHYADGYREFDGLTLPTRRRVHPRLGNGRSLGRPTLIWIEIDDVRPDFD